MSRRIVLGVAAAWLAFASPASAVTCNPGDPCADDLNPCTDDVCDTNQQCTHPPNAICDHFTCYKGKIASGSPPFLRQSVSLVDEFGTRIADVVKPTNLCAPTDKMNENPSASSHPDHLASYHIKLAVKPALPPNQVFSNQFGTITVDPKKPGTLLVPAAKSFVAFPPPPTSPAIDHFQCYPVKLSKGSPRFSVISGVTLHDQFGAMTVDVRKPRRLCTPVDQNGQSPGAEAHAVHLMCYQVRQSSLPRFAPITAIFAATELGPETLIATAPAELCVPSFENPACGNGVVEPGEECEPAAGDCCDTSCHLKPTGTACTPDANPCTDDVCSGTSADCAHPNNTAPCDDGVFCNGTDTCVGGSCDAHTGDPCAAGAECNNICDEAADSCISAAGTPCDDGVFCNGADVCAGGVCTHAGDPCTGGAECADLCDEVTDTCNVPVGTPCTPAGDPCLQDVCNGFGQCGLNTCVFTFSGVLTDVPIASLNGWTLCYLDTYGNSSTMLADIQSACNRPYLLLGCRDTGSSTLQLAANAPRVDVLFDTGLSDTPHDANGVGWYYNAEYSWGFAPQGDSIHRISCDTFEPNDSDLRLCWHTGLGLLRGGFRCGADTYLNQDGLHERLIFQHP